MQHEINDQNIGNRRKELGKAIKISLATLGIGTAIVLLPYTSHIGQKIDEYSRTKIAGEKTAMQENSKKLPWKEVKIQPYDSLARYASPCTSKTGGSELYYAKMIQFYPGNMKDGMPLDANLQPGKKIYIPDCK
jgi:hypothetical protein